MNDPDPKPCKICHAVKSLTEFSKSSQRKSGLKTHCKACDREINRINYCRRKGQQVKDFKWQDIKGLSLDLQEDFDGLYGTSDVKEKGKLVMSKGKVLDEEWYRKKLLQLKKGRKD